MAPGIRHIAAVVVAVVVVIVSGSRVSGRRYVVGDDVGWTTGVNYSLWTAGKSFYVGDSLYFDYLREDHDVLQVGYEDYKTCTVSSTMTNYTEGGSIVELPSVGIFYFVCSLGDHCLEGQKLQVSVYMHPLANIPPPSSFGPNTMNQYLPSTDTSSSLPSFVFSWACPPLLVVDDRWMAGALWWYVASCGLADLVIGCVFVAPFAGSIGSYW
ncbi:hypothetical protein GOP47_0003703 [Adiantum capillus-veneris]|uniref:Phytocyanin domain-containing protein n=1 Tax=Adiantum capillus-veneris TaxID=13818 RepID=A0A9D4V642_ADICA|nr:hypothetical protein GOP47_0003703 [Adiantum capillus-veneris]